MYIFATCVVVFRTTVPAKHDDDDDPLATTFTRRSSRSGRARVALLSSPREHTSVCCFHSTCTSLLMLFIFYTVNSTFS